jgi:Ca2+-binding RTX toxin-like protein
VNLEELTDHIIERFSGLVSQTVKKLRSEIAEVREELKRSPHGPAGEKGDTGKDGINGKDGAPGINGKDGLDGKNGIDGKDGAQGKDGRDGIDGKDGKDGLPGKDGINGKDGKDGIDGKDGATGLDGKDGAPGINGKDGLDGAIGPRGERGEKGESGIIGKDGRDGRDGKDGRDGVDGKDGSDGLNGKDALEIDILPSIDEEKSYPRGTFAKYKSGLWRAASNTQGMRGWECLVDGLAGINFEQKDERTFAFNAMLSSGVHVAKEFTLSAVIYREIYRPETEYRKGDAVTYGGSFWVALVDLPTKKPGDPTDGTDGTPQQWRLAVKKGAPGKDSK